MVSVVVPTYNRGNIIGFTLDSLKGDIQGVPVEVIVVDDGSTDNTLAILADNYPWVKVIVNPGKGAPAARNTGLKAATGNYILFLDSDDLLGKNYLAAKVHYLDQNPDVGMCFGDYEFFASDDDNVEDHIIFKHKYQVTAGPGNEAAHLENYLRGSYLPPIAFLWRKSIVTDIGGYDESLIVNQDVELFIRAILNDVRIGFVQDGTMVYVRSHEMDDRVGVIAGVAKLEAILRLREKVWIEIEKRGLGNTGNRKALSTFLFASWKRNRHVQPAIARAYLDFSKKLFWPVALGGNGLFALLGRLIGPEKAVELKYNLLKRD